MTMDRFNFYTLLGSQCHDSGQMNSFLNFYTLWGSQFHDTAEFYKYILNKQSLTAVMLFFMFYGQIPPLQIKDTTLKAIILQSKQEFAIIEKMCDEFKF